MCMTEGRPFLVSFLLAVWLTCQNFTIFRRFLKTTWRTVTFGEHFVAATRERSWHFRRVICFVPETTETAG